MDKRVAVENTLTSYIDFLEESGYDVRKIYLNENINNISSFDYDAVVIKNEDSLSLDVNYRPNAPIVTTEGKTPEEIFNILRTRY